ncbi:hypothetical protein AVEN_131336-1, partial [Araneus ventricosus]
MIYTLNKLKNAIRCKKPRLLSRGVILSDDYAGPNTTRNRKEHIRRLVCERLDDPAYSTDLAPSDFHLIPALKSALSEAMK